MDRLALDHPIAPVGRDERTQLVALANAACVSIDECVDLVATVEPDVGGLEVLPAKRMDDAIDVVAVDMDNSPTSRQFIETLAASPGITIAERASDLGAAASANRSPSGWGR